MFKHAVTRALQDDVTGRTLKTLTCCDHGSGCIQRPQRKNLLAIRWTFRRCEGSRRSYYLKSAYVRACVWSNEGGTNVVFSTLWRCWWETCDSENNNLVVCTLEHTLRPAAVYVHIRRSIQRTKTAPICCITAPSYLRYYYMYMYMYMYAIYARTMYLSQNTRRLWGSHLTLMSDVICWV